MVGLLVAPSAAGEDEEPEPSYRALFDACQGVPRSSFSDVSRSHPHAGDIDCVAYYGIAAGTSATRFSPSATVTRQQMALFLARLAAVVGIEMKDRPDDPGYVDTSHLPGSARIAIARLVDLGVFQVTPEARFEPSRVVTRSAVALPVVRLMDLMTPLNDPLFDIVYGYKPSDVGEDLETTPDVNESEEVGTPFTDLDTAIKVHYDAVVPLYELGVVSGTSATTYGPHLPITRASLAGIMAAVLDHSNARPTGLTLQATPLSGWGDTDVTLVVSMRDRRQAALADQTIDVFSSIDPHGGLSDAGECNREVLHTGDCQWSQEDEVTDINGNLFVVDVVPGGDTGTFYAWIGSEEGQVFDLTKATFASVSIPTRRGQTALQVTGLTERAATLDSGADLDTDNDEPQVDLGVTRRVNLTVQLVHGATEKVPRPDVEITVTRNRIVADYDDTDTKSYFQFFPEAEETILTTGRGGSATFTIQRPEDEEEDDRQEFVDVVTFQAGNLQATQKVRWIEEERVTHSADGVATDYVILDSRDRARVSATVTLYDQYGKRFRQAPNQRATINFEGSGESDDGTAPVRVSGVASRSVTLEGQSAGTDITVSYDPVDVTTDPVDLDEVVTNPPDDKVSVVARATRSDNGAKAVHTLYASRNLFTTEAGAHDDPAESADRIYRYDFNDIYFGHGHRFNVREFEELLANPTDDQGNPAVNQAVVNVLVYDPGGTSIFVVTTDSMGE